MNSKKLSTTYLIMKKTIKTAVLDNSFLMILLILLSINAVSLYYYESVLIEGLHHSFKEPFFMISLSSSILLMIYGGYLGTKFFVRELEEKRMSSLFMLPEGRDPIYFGKICAGLFILGTITVLSFIQIYLSLNYWGSISLLTVLRISGYLISIFLASIFVFFISIIIGISTKKSMGSMLFSMVFVVFSFFISNMILKTEKGIETYTKVMVLPFLNIRYSDLFIIEYGEFPMIFLAVPLISIFWAFIVSFILFRGLKL